MSDFLPSGITLLTVNVFRIIKEEGRTCSFSHLFTVFSHSWGCLIQDMDFVCVLTKSEQNHFQVSIFDLSQTTKIL